MAKVLTGISGNVISAASAGFAPTNSADVSAIASAYQVVSATATQLYAGTAYVTSVNDAPLSASRAGNAANASLATSAYYDGTGRLISALPDSAAVSAIASAYQVVSSTATAVTGETSYLTSVNETPISAARAGNAAMATVAIKAYTDPDGRYLVDLVDIETLDSWTSGKQDALTFGYDDGKISSIDGSALAGQGGGGSVGSPSGTIIVTDGTAIEATNSAIGTAESFDVNNSDQANYSNYSNTYEFLGGYSTFKSKGVGLLYNSSTATRTAWVSANTTLGNLVSSFVLPASSISACGLLSTSNINSIWDSQLKVEDDLTLSGSYPVLFVSPGAPYSAVKELAWKDDIPAPVSLGVTPSNYVSSLNSLRISASYAGTASTVNTATYARYDINSRPLTSFITKSDIPSIASPSGTIAVTDYDIEATNSAVVTGVFPGYGLRTVSYTGSTVGTDGSVTATLPLAHPNAELVVGLGYGYGGTASAVFDGHTSTASAGNGYGPATAILKVPNATTARLYADTWRSVQGISASALYGTGITGVGELAWASALPTYSYDAENKISAINGSAIAGGSTYSAGEGIDIIDDEISVDYDTNTLDVTGQAVTENVTQQSSSGLFLLPSSVAALLSQQADTQVTVHIPANMLRDVNFDYSEEPSITFRFTLYATDSTSETNVSLFSTALSWENYDGEYGLIDEQDIVFNLPASVANQWSRSLSSAVAFSICGQRYSMPDTSAPVELFGDLSTDPITFTFVDASATKLAVKNPLPSSTSADEGKCLVVDSNGDPEWGTGGKVYTGTDGVVVDNVNDTVGLEAPVDIVAGPGIVVDNPDGNTLRVSQAANYEVVLWEGSLTDANCMQAFDLNDNPFNFEYLRFYWNVDNCSMVTEGRVITGNADVCSDFGWFYQNWKTIKNLLRFTAPVGSTPANAQFIEGISYAQSTSSANMSDFRHNWSYCFRPLVKIVGIHRLANN